MQIPFVDLKAQYLSIKEEIDTAIQNVINDTAFIKGKYVQRFEDDYAEIYDLFPGSTVKIMKLSGSVIRDLQGGILSQNDTAVRWDGRNTTGELVGSGVYLVAVSHPDGGDAVSKIAVIRQ